MRKIKIHYAWWILLSCCLIQGAGIGMVQNCTGLFFQPISKDFGVQLVSVTMFSSIESISMCVSMLFAMKTINKWGLRPIMTICSCFTAFSTFFMSLTTNIYQLYFLAVFQGIGMGCLCTAVVPVILNNWFVKSLGFAVGLSGSFSGIVGALMNGALGVIFRHYSWRTGFMVLGTSIFLATVPVSLFVLKLNPKEKNLLAYGENESIQLKNNTVSTESLSAFDRSILFIIVCAMLIKVPSSFVSHIPNMGKSMSITIVDVSILSVLCMIGNASLKIVFGRINDSIGTRKTANIALGIFIISTLLIISANQYLVCIGVFFFSSCSMFSLTMIPLIAKETIGKKNYMNAITFTSVGGYLMYAVSTSIIGMVYDISGNYLTVLIMQIVIAIVIFLIVNYLFIVKEKKNGTSNI